MLGLLIEDMGLFTFILTIIAISVPTLSIDVTIKGRGTVRGSTQIRFGKIVDSFWAIPFAEPPVGELRFAPTKPAKPWKGTRNATFTKIVCPQYVSSSKKIIGTEDCLYLNIFRPRSVSRRKLPVLFWVHGGSFIQGSAFSYNGDVIAARFNVVVVAVNYRLGIFGFFNIPGSTTSGNFGLLDQIEALKWVKQSIQDFDGDPNQVTIAGLSAGSASVSLLMLSPLTKGLFNRVIAQSGAPISVWAIHRTLNSTFSKNFSAKLGCNDVSKLESCLKSVFWMDVLKSQIDLSGTENTIAPFVDKHVISEYPYKQYKEDRLPSPDVDLLIGFTKDEGSSFVPSKIPLTLATMKIIMRSGLRWNYGPIVGLVTEMASFQYQKYKLPSDADFAHPIKRFLDDFYFKLDILNFAGAWSKKRNQTYVYEFSYLPAHPKFPKWKVAHAIEKAFVFGSPLRKIGDPWRRNWLVGNFTEEEKVFSMNIMKMWTDFVKTGNPGGSWPQFETQRGRYLQIDRNNTVKESYEPRMTAFWNKHIPAVLKLASDEKCKSADKSTSKSVSLAPSQVIQHFSYLLCALLVLMNRS